MSVNNDSNVKMTVIILTALKSLRGRTYLKTYTEKTPVITVKKAINKCFLFDILIT